MTKLSDLKATPFNPRKISPKALSGLGYSIEEFGDISGIVINQQTDNIVSGHQRIKALQAKYGDLEISEVDGNIVTPSGDNFHVRYVDWPIDKEKAANVAANNPHISGDWTASLGDLLGEIQADLPDLFDSLNFEDLLADVPEIEVEAGGGETEGQESPGKDKRVKCPECGCEFEPGAE